MTDRDDNNLLWLTLGFVLITLIAMAGQRVLDHHYPPASEGEP